MRLMNIFKFTEQILGFGAITIFVQLHPMFRGLKWRSFRALAFVVTGLSGFAPIGHGIQKFGLVLMMKQSGLTYYLCEGVVMCIGAGLFIVCLIP
jgi:adiponectin receptor